MKKIMTVLALCFVTIFVYGQDFYMYVNGEKRTFEISSTQMLIKSKIHYAVDIKNIMQSINVNEANNVYDLHSNISLIEIQSESRENIMELKKQWSSKEDVVFVSPVFVDEIGREIGGFTNQILIRLKQESDYRLLRRSLASYQIKNIKQCDFDRLVYLITIERISEKNAMQIANELYRTGFFDYAEPNLIHFLELTTNDQHFQHQWGLHSTFGIRTPQAWTIATGSNIRIAILDNGVDLNHPDLNLLPGFDATGNNSGGAPIGNLDDFAHGTASAGVAAARGNNTIGIAGVAHSSRILPVRIATRARNWTTTESNFIRIGIEWAVTNGADVISMSFGCIETAALNTAIVNATTSGRNNNLGSVLVAASGNGGAATVSFPAIHTNVISVGATNNQGHRAPFSSHGTNLDIVAPGVGIYTTGMLGATGYGTVINNGIDGVYFTGYAGTSAAAPHVAGVAALVLSVNPNLTAQHVRNIIEYTANRNLPGWVTNQHRPNGTWNNHFGHGLVDAYAAVREAQACAELVVEFRDNIVNRNRTIESCGGINVENVTVTNNARLTLDAPGTVRLGPGFRVEAGSSLMVKPE